MKLYELSNLPDELQYQAVWDQEVYIDTIIFNRVYQLYAINDFYVEILYDVADNKITGKLAFKGGDPLNKFLVQFPR